MGNFNVLGINDDHNSGASLIMDGELVAAVSEERFKNIKNLSGYPFKSIEYCLKEGNISPQEITFIVISGKVQHPLWVALKRIENYSIDDYIFEQNAFWSYLPAPSDKYFIDILENYVDVVASRKKITSLKKSLNNWMGKSFEESLRIFNEIRINSVVDHLGIHKEIVFFADHHKCHAAYGFFSSKKRNNSVTLTMDASGDGSNASISLGNDNVFKEVFRTNKCDLARLFRNATLVLGLKPNDHEYKVMGLAAYAHPNEIDQAKKNISHLFQNVKGIDFFYKSRAIPYEHQYNELISSTVGLRFDILAGVLQNYLESRVCEWVYNIIEKFNARNINFAGGVAMNVKLNQKLSQMNSVNSIFIPPGPGDESLCIGAAYLGFNIICNKFKIPLNFIKPLESAYLGPSMDPSILKNSIQKFNELGYKVSKYNTKKVAEELMSGKIIGRCVGRMEFGARALGNRSILIDPVDSTKITELNKRVKQRDFWMPFAPILLEKDASSYFNIPSGVTTSFMTMACDSTLKARKEAPAALHPYDYTGRPQIIIKDSNPELEELISEFKRITGRGILLNTSLNIHGQPIVLNSIEASKMLISGSLDCLILDDYFISKS